MYVCIYLALAVFVSNKSFMCVVYKTSYSCHDNKCSTNVMTFLVN